MDERSGGSLLLPMALIGLGCYFVFSAVQGEGGVFRRIALEAERQRLVEERDALDLRVAEARGRVERLSDDYLDLDLLDERARIVLGRVRADEIVLD